MDRFGTRIKRTWVVLTSAGTIIAATPNLDAQSSHAPRNVVDLFVGAGGEWQHCADCPGHYSNPLVGPVVEVRALGDVSRIRIGAEAAAWIEVLPLTFDTPPTFTSSYVGATSEWPVSRQDDFVATAGMGYGWHRSGHYGGAASGPTASLGIAGSLKNWDAAALRWRLNYQRSLSGDHAAFNVIGGQPGAYRPELITLSFGLRFGFGS